MDEWSRLKSLRKKYFSCTGKRLQRELLQGLRHTMRTLRSKLFISMGAILFFSALFNGVFSEIWIKQDLHRVSDSLTKHVQIIQDHIRKFSSFLLTFRIIEQATELDRITNLPPPSHQEELSLWDVAAKILLFDSDISFVQVKNAEGKSLVVTPNDAKPQTFSWAPASHSSLWIKLPTENAIWTGVLEQAGEDSFYLLFSGDEPAAEDMNLHFQTLSPSYSPRFWGASASEVFQTLLIHEHQWIDKIKLIQHLLFWKAKHPALDPVGILTLDASRHTGLCLLSQEILQEKPSITPPVIEQNSPIPLLFLRGKDLDIMKTFSLQKFSVTLGFSLSSLLQELSALFHRTLIVLSNDFSLGFSPDGHSFFPEDQQFPFSSIQSSLSKDHPAIPAEALSPCN